jgi:iron(III) transport system ATP-binding protein
MTTNDAALVVDDLHKLFVSKGETVAAVDGVSFEVPTGSFFTLLGSSGCGKTTTLRCVAGLEQPTAGNIVLGGETVYQAGRRRNVPTSRRDIGMVFQSYAIWPHMSVFKNVAFPLRVERHPPPRAEIKKRVEEALAAVQLDGLESRMATQLSGGQQQRLAFARALVRRPKVLLLDEPLSNLDAKLRGQMRAEMRALQRRIGITTLYVTHDQMEALSMSNRIAVMSHGKIVQEGPPRAIYHQPTTRFVADFIGTTNFLEAEVLGPSALDTMRLRTAAGDLDARCPAGVRPGEAVSISVRPENIRVSAEQLSGRNVLEGVLEQQYFLGEFLDCRVRVGSAVLLCRVHPTVRFHRGDPVWVEVPAELCVVLSDEFGVSAEFDGGDQDEIESDGIDGDTETDPAAGFPVIAGN